MTKQIPYELIPAADLPRRAAAGSRDSMVGVDESTGAAVRFPLDRLPTDPAVWREINAIRGSQGSGLPSYALRSDLPAPGTLPRPAGGGDPLVTVTNDPNPENLGAWRDTGSVWVKSEDRVTVLAESIAQVDSRFDLGQVIGREAPVAAGAGAAPNTRIFADPVKRDGVIRRVVLAASAASAQLVIRRFVKSGVAGQVSVGDVFTQVGSDATIPGGAPGVLHFDVSIPVAAGEYIGFYNGTSGAYRQQLGVPEDGAGYVTAATAGDHTVLTAALLTTGNRLEIGFLISSPYLTSDLVEEIEVTQAQLVAGAPVVVASQADLPGPFPGKIAIVTDTGPMWSDGVLWRAFADNSPAQIPYMQILGLAQDDGWFAVYDVNNPTTLAARHSGASQFVQQIADGMGNAPPVSQGAEPSQPSLSAGVFGPLGAMSFDGSEWLRSSGGTLSDGVFVMAVCRYDGPSSLGASRYLVDGRAPGNRRAVLADGATDKFAAWYGGSAQGTALSGSPRVLGALFGINHGSPYGHPTELIENGLTTGLGNNNDGNFDYLTIGADYAGARGWTGACAMILLYQGRPSRTKIRRMSALLSQLSHIPLAPVSLSAEGAATARVSDGQILFSKADDVAVSPSSTAKLMTAAVAEKYVPDWDATTTFEAGDIVSGTMFQEGDVVTLRDLLHSSLVASDNMAANKIGRVVGHLLLAGGAEQDARDRFIVEMNALASDLGMTDSNYTNPWGAGGLVSPRDQCKLMAHIAKNAPLTRSAGGQMTWTVSVIGVNARTESITNSYAASAHYLPEVVSGKTGTGDNLGSFVCLWVEDGVEYVTAICRSSPHTDRYLDTRRAMDVVL